MHSLLGTTVTCFCTFLLCTLSKPVSGNHSPTGRHQPSISAHAQDYGHGRCRVSDCASDSPLMQLKELSNSCSALGHRWELAPRCPGSDKCQTMIMEKASRRNCIWCFSLSELGTIDVCSSGFVTSLSFYGCTHKKRWHKCLWWIFITAWDNLFWVSLQSSPSFLTWGLQHVLHLKSVWRLQLEQGIAACLGKGISQVESTCHLDCMIFTACQAASPL